MTFANNSLSPIFADRAYTYKVTAPPEVTPITLSEVKSFAKISTTTDNSLITMMIEAATEQAEKFTRRDFITRTYKTFRDSFPGDFQGLRSMVHRVNAFTDSGNHGFEIRRSPLQSIESVKYIDTTGAVIVIPTTVYYSTLEEDYSTLLTQQGQSWPDDEAEQLQVITVEFKTGFGDEATDIPGDIRNALLQHVTWLYENRGDCDDGTNIPPAAKRTYLQYRIENL